MTSTAGRHRRPVTLGTVLTVWAHPDDETYLAGGLLAALTRRRPPRRLRDGDPRRGGRPGCRAGRAGRARRACGPGSSRRHWRMLGVTEHHWLDLPRRRLRRGGPEVPVARLVAPARRGAARHGGDLRPGRLHRPPRPPGRQRLDRPRRYGRSAAAPRLLHAVGAGAARRPGARRGVRGLRARPAADVHARTRSPCRCPLDGAVARPQGRRAAAAGSRRPAGWSRRSAWSGSAPGWPRSSFAATAGNRE